MEDKDNLLKDSAYLRYLEGLKPEYIAKRYFIKNDNNGWLNDIQVAKRITTPDGKFKFKFASSFIGPSASFLNGLIVHQLEPQIPSHLKLNAAAVAEDINKFLSENEEYALEISTDLTDSHHYAEDMAIEMLKIYGRGLKFIKSRTNGFNV